MIGVVRIVSRSVWSSYSKITSGVDEASENVASRVRLAVESASTMVL